MLSVKHTMYIFDTICLKVLNLSNINFAKKNLSKYVFFLMTYFSKNFFNTVVLDR